MVLIYGLLSISTSRPDTPPPRVPRRASAPIPRKECFFCGDGDKPNEVLHRVSTTGSANRIIEAVHKGTNSAWKIQLPPDLDVLAADVMYHKGCWSIHVVNQLRTVASTQQEPEDRSVIEFVEEVSEKLESGVVLSMGEIDAIKEQHGVGRSRWRIKELLSTMVPGVEFTKPKNPREPELVHLAEARKEALTNQRTIEDFKLATLLKAAKILREETLKEPDWKFEGDMANFNLPPLVKSFATWVVGGAGRNNLRTEKGASIIGQVLMTNILSAKQAATITQASRTRETPLQVATALAIHQETRSKAMIQMFHGAGLAISYSSLLRLEASLARTVLSAGRRDGVFIPRRLEKGLLVHFAIDNIDFQEDTVDGKGTFHGTVTVAFQPGPSSPSELEPLKFHSDAAEPLPAAIYEVSPCPMNRSLKPKLPQLSFEKPRLESAENSKDKDTLVLLSFGIAALKDLPRSMPSWSAFNSRLEDVPPVPPTTICPLPILDSPAPEYSSLFTMMTEMEKIQQALNGDGAPVLVAADMALFSKLLEIKLNLKKENWIVRLGDLHVVIAMLRCIGVFLEGSGFDEVLHESGVYGHATVRQILAGNHVNRGTEAHLILTSALLALKFSSGTMERAEEFAVKELAKDGRLDSFKKALEILAPKLQILRSAGSDDSPLSKFSMTYVKMVLLLLNYTRAVRTGDWALHLKTLEEFGPFFFALNRSSYARFVPVYVAMMQDLRLKNPRAWTYLEKHWVVRKSLVPFTSLGCDHALEQVNRALKGDGGLVGITKNPSTRTKFFLIQDELLAIKAKSFGRSATASKHHKDSPAVTKKTHEMTKEVAGLLRQHNPFTREKAQLTTVLSRKVAPDEMVDALTRIEETGKEALLKYEEGRIRTAQQSPWEVLHRLPTKTFKTLGKKAKVSIGGKKVIVTGSSDLNRRLLLAVQLDSSLDLRTIISIYELSLFPLALFDDQGYPRVTTKSALLRVLEKMNAAVSTASQRPSSSRVLVLDGMAILQQHPVSGSANFKELVGSFLQRVARLGVGYGELHLVFDRYDIGASLKDKTREQRARGGGYDMDIQAATRIKAGMTMAHILSTKSNKDAMTSLIASQIQHHSWGLRVVCAWRGKAVATSGPDGAKFASEQEEADTKMIYHLSLLDKDVEATVVSPDTDVLVLLLRHFPKIPPNTCLQLGKTTFNVQLIHDKLGSHADVITSFHALTGCDTTCALFRKGKLQAWPVFQAADQATLDALGTLRSPGPLTQESLDVLCRFVSRIYGYTCSLPQARWTALQKKKVGAALAPPTVAATTQHIMRAQLQAVVWEGAVKKELVTLDPTKYGYEADLAPIPSTLPPAPQSIMDVMQCGCKTNCSTNRCRCQRLQTPCSELCDCSPEMCINDEEDGHEDVDGVDD